MFEPFYNLSEQPFQLSPDPAFFYGSRGHKRAYAYLQYGLYQGEGFITLTGEVGAGKTTLIRNLIANAGGRRIALIINEFGDVGVDGEILKACGNEAKVVHMSATGA